ncbi:MAG: hypothetical protein ACI4BH_01305 [Muribaculaceae bacterium]
MLNSYGVSTESIKTFVEHLQKKHADTINSAYNRHCESMNNHGIKFHFSKLFPGDGIPVIDLSPSLR